MGSQLLTADKQRELQAPQLPDVGAQHGRVCIQEQEEPCGSGREAPGCVGACWCLVLRASTCSEGAQQEMQANPLQRGTLNRHLMWKEMPCRTVLCTELREGDGNDSDERRYMWSRMCGRGRRKQVEEQEM